MQGLGEADGHTNEAQCPCGDGERVCHCGLLSCAVVDWVGGGE